MKTIFLSLCLIVTSSLFAQEDVLDCKKPNLSQMELNMCSSLKLDEEVAKLTKKVLAVCMKDSEVQSERGGTAYEQVLNECAQAKVRVLSSKIK
jgi:uncharacterized protein